MLEQHRLHPRMVGNVGREDLWEGSLCSMPQTSFVTELEMWCQGGQSMDKPSSLTSCSALATASQGSGEECELVPWERQGDMTS